MLKQTQEEIYEWSKRNFGSSIRIAFNPFQTLQSAVMLGKMAHSLLKISQNIRGKKQDLSLIYEGAKEGLRNINSASSSSLPPADFDADISSLLGVIEEVGEIAFAVLTKDPKEIEDGIADTFVYLLDFCARNGYDGEKSLKTTWEKVKQRDWKKDPKRGGEVS